MPRKRRNWKNKRSSSSSALHDPARRRAGVPYGIRPLVCTPQAGACLRRPIVTIVLEKEKRTGAAPDPPSSSKPHALALCNLL